MGQFPNPDTQFKKGQSGNAGGMSKETKAKIDAARDKAADVYLKLATALQETLTEGDAASALEAIRGDNLKLLKDVMDRSIGTPKQTIEQDTTLREAPKGLDAFYAATDSPAQGDNEQLGGTPSLEELKAL